MTNEEALKRFKTTYEMTKDHYDPHWEGSEYREHRKWVEQLECAIEALEKQIPKKPIWFESDYCRFTKCPACGQPLGFKSWFGHCENCGQASYRLE